MNISKKDFRKLYLLQDKFLSWWVTLGLPFYLTGGTALGRFYLNHRYSEDLDFFINADPIYLKYISEIEKKIKKKFDINLQESLFTEDFVLFYIYDNEDFLKIEIRNNVDYHAGRIENYRYGKIDSPLNVLANKITALVGRDEPKDIVDIIHLSENFAFNWPETFEHAKNKAILNELDAEHRLITFRVEWLENVNWLNSPVEVNRYRNLLKIIADDFLLGRKNSLGINQKPIEMAKPLSC